MCPAFPRHLKCIGYLSFHVGAILALVQSAPPHFLPKRTIGVLLHLHHETGPDGHFLQVDSHNMSLPNTILATELLTRQNKQ